MVTNHISLFSADFIPSFCSIFGSSVYFLGHKTRNKILYPMMLLALRSPHLEGTVIFGHLQSFWSLFHPSAAGAPTPFLGLSRRSADSSCIRSRMAAKQLIKNGDWRTHRNRTTSFPPSSTWRGVCSFCTVSKGCAGALRFHKPTWPLSIESRPWAPKGWSGEAVALCSISRAFTNTWLCGKMMEREEKAKALWSSVPDLLSGKGGKLDHAEMETFWLVEIKKLASFLLCTPLPC